MLKKDDLIVLITAVQLALIVFMIWWCVDSYINREDNIKVEYPVYDIIEDVDSCEID